MQDILDQEQQIDINKKLLYLGRLLIAVGTCLVTIANLNAASVLPNEWDCNQTDGYYYL